MRKRSIQIRSQLNVGDTLVTYPSRAAADYIRFHINHLHQIVAADTNGRPFHITGKPNSPPDGSPQFWQPREPKAIAAASLPADPPSCPPSEVLSSTGYHRSSSNFIFTKKNYYFKTHLAIMWRTQLDDETFQPSTPRPRKGSRV